MGGVPDPIERTEEARINAVFKAGGKQFRAEAGERLRVPPSRPSPARR